MLHRGKLHLEVIHSNSESLNEFIYRISEDLLEDAIHEVGNELDYVCDDYAEALYNEEFANADT